ncbi:MAG: YraN family protein [Rhodospirillaceae bacterium]|nr:MAG: YraN family protein [Rhodospirillaceae bacterium]
MTSPNDSARRDAERWGRHAELLCVIRLRLTGWRILSRRLTAARGSGQGEIDIVARRGKVLAFIEVKARSRRDEGLAAVTPHQQQRLARAAASFLGRRTDLAALDVRFDVMVVGPGVVPYHLADAWRPSF